MKHTRESLLKKLQTLTEDKVRPPTHQLKKLLIREGLLENRCYICGLGNHWNGKSISLHMDHIDGDGTNNRLDNLRVICPNCHSQTETYCGRSNKGKKRKRTYARKCTRCGTEADNSRTLRCKSCIEKEKYRPKPKISWPSDEELQEMLDKRKSMESLAKKLGVSSNAVRKHARRRNLIIHKHLERQ